MMFKKFAALMLVLCLVCGTVALATEVNQDSTDKTANTTVSYTIDPIQTYTVTIPSKIDLTKSDDGANLTGTMRLAVAGPDYNVTNKLLVYVKSGNGGYLKRTIVDEVGYEYSLIINTESINLKAGERQLITTLGREALNNGFSTDLLVNAAFGDWDAGTYEDTLTFSVVMEIIDGDVN